MIYHITTYPTVAGAQQQGVFRTDSLDNEGFIHFSTAQQLLRVANAFYREVPDLVVLLVDETQLTSPLVWEAPVHPASDAALDAPPQEQFPHLYGALNLSAIVDIVPLTADASGFVLPSGVV